jgi:alkanesulfonate monooxygenase SsuD/methylene tetrahydromethanopterin reductase-like flavin-dependent oxidoreductase (luciferase family)
MSRAEFEQEIQAGSLYAGSPETVARKIVATMTALGVKRFDMKYSAGSLSHGLMMRSIELYGRQVVPRVREMLATA